MEDAKITEYILSGMMVAIAFSSIISLGKYLPPDGIATPTESMLGLFLMLFIIYIFVENLQKACEGASLLIKHFLSKKVKEALNIK